MINLIIIVDQNFCLHGTAYLKGWKEYNQRQQPTHPIFINFYSFTDGMKRLPSIQQVACHEDKKYNLIVLLCNNGK